jgi:hypothetical protein
MAYHNAYLRHRGKLAETVAEIAETIRKPALQCVLGSLFGRPDRGRCHIRPARSRGLAASVAAAGAIEKCPELNI